MTTTASRLSVCALTVAALLGAPAAVHAAPAKGLQDDTMILTDDVQLRNAFWQDAKSARVKTVRVLVRFDGKSAVPDPDRLVRIRRAALEGEQHGVKLLVGSYVTIGRGKSARYRVPTKMFNTYATFMGTIARELSDIRLAGYLTFNEPNYKTAWPQKQERRWVAFSNRAYRAIKANDRDAKVLVGEPSPEVRTSFGSTNPGAFFRKALCLTKDYRSVTRTKACRTKLLGDGFTLHTYDFRRAPNRPTKNPDAWVQGNLKTTVRQIKRLARAGRISSTAARNIHITEFAYRTEGGHKTPDRRAASWLKLAWNGSKRAGIKTFIWYQLRDPAGRSDFKSGLKTAHGTPRRTWNTFRALR